MLRFTVRVTAAQSEKSEVLRFYKRRGYAIKRLLRNYYADGADGYLMEKALS